MLETIAVETNRKKRTKCCDNFQATCIAKINNFIRLCFLRDVYKSNMESIEKLFSEEHLRSIFRRTMTFTRFKTLRRMLRFDKRNTRNARLCSNNLAGFCFLFNSLASNSQSCYLVVSTVTVEQLGLYSFRNRCRNIPSKPAKYALKFWSVNDPASAVTQLMILPEFVNAPEKAKHGKVVCLVSMLF